MSLKSKIEKKSCVVALLGIGYVGFNIGLVIAKKGFSVLGFDLNVEKVKEVEEKKIAHFHATEDFSKLASADIIIVTVPTLIYSDKHPNLQCLKDAGYLLQKHLRKGQLIVLESTVSPGMTRNDFISLVCQENGLKPDVDFFVGYSPERIDPGNVKYTVQNIPKIVAGWGESSLDLTRRFYESVVDHVVPVSSIEVAELAKMVENVVRFVTINLINEIEDYAVKKGINLWEVIDAAATKPFGFFPCYPSPGIGGHCIPVNFYYLLEDADRAGVDCTILKHVASFHEKRIERIVDRAFAILKEKKGARIFVLGVSIKPESDNVAESVGLKMLKLIRKKGGVASYHDPFVPQIADFVSEPFSKEVLEKKDLFIIITDHTEIDFKLLLPLNKPIIDTKNVFREKNENVFRI